MFLIPLHENIRTRFANLIFENGPHIFSNIHIALDQFE